MKSFAERARERMAADRADRVDHQRTGLRLIANLPVGGEDVRETADALNEPKTLATAKRIAKFLNAAIAMAEKNAAKAKKTAKKCVKRRAKA